MCCTFTESEMSNTRIYSGEAKKNGKNVHVLAYQNSAVSSGANAMVIPFPTDVAMGQDNVIDTSKFKNFLRDITEATKIKTFSKGSRGITIGAAYMDADSLAEVFDVGSYTVVLADHVKQIPEALGRVPANRRPQVSLSFLIGYGILYPKQPIAVCCWYGSIEAEPLMWWYEPRDQGTLFIPTMDVHDGKAPRVGEKVETDHIISVGSADSTNGTAVTYTQKIPANVRDLLPTHVYGKKLPHRMSNADCFVKTGALHISKAEYFSGKGAKAVELVRGYADFVDSSTVMNGWS